MAKVTAIGREIHHAVDDDRAGLEADLLAGVERADQAEPGDVGRS